VWSANEGKILPLGFPAPGLTYIHTYTHTHTHTHTYVRTYVRIYIRT